jgi:hypothetical protein
VYDENSEQNIDSQHFMLAISPFYIPSSHPPTHQSVNGQVKAEKKEEEEPKEK